MRRSLRITGTVALATTAVAAGVWGFTSQQSLAEAEEDLAAASQRVAWLDREVLNLEGDMLVCQAANEVGIEMAVILLDAAESYTDTGVLGLLKAMERGGDVFTGSKHAEALGYDTQGALLNACRAL